MMQDPGDYRRQLITALESEFDEVIGFPPDLVPSGEVAIVYPDDPYLESGTYCDWVAHMSVVVFYGRTNEEEALDRAEETAIKVMSAALVAGATWEGMAYRPINVGGVDYLTAIHEIIFNKEG